MTYSIPEPGPSAGWDPAASPSLVDRLSEQSDVVRDLRERRTQIPHPEQPTDQRSLVAGIAVGVGLAGGSVQNLLDMGRIAVKLPELTTAGAYAPGLGKLGRLPSAAGILLLTPLGLSRPDSRIVDPSAPPIRSVASAGKSFTALDARLMKSSVLIGSSLAFLTTASGLVNLVDAVRQDGPWHEELAGSTAGRTGVLQVLGGAMGLGLFATAIQRTKAPTGGVVSTVLAASKSPIMAKPLFSRLGAAFSVAVFANELGYLDSLNAGETRSFTGTLGAAARHTPVLNDPTFRTATLGLIGGGVGASAIRAARTGGLGAIGPVKLGVGALVAGLVGAQALGGLHRLDG